MGTQMVKVALSSLVMGNTYTKEDGTKITGRELLDQMMGQIRELSKLGKEKVDEKFYTDGKIDQEKLGKFLREQLTSRDSDKSIIDAISVVKTTIADKIIYTGQIDEFYDYCYGKLDWRTVSFKTRVEDRPNYQGNAVVNYTSHDEPYTRVIEHKHFEMFGQEVYNCPKTVVSEEYSTEYKEGMEPYYPVNDDRNNALAEKYRALASQEKNVIFGGRLAEYKYYDMAPIVEKVLNMEIKKWNS